MNYTRIAVVVNPASANGATFKRWPEIAAAFESEDVTYVHSFTEGPGHATELTRDYLEKGFDLIISVGGDGTVNEVINGFFDVEKPVSENASFGYISTGTGGDLGRTIGTPKDLAASIRKIVDSSPRPLDVGKVTFINNLGNKEIRYFINVAGIGLDGDTVDRVNRTSKVFGGFISFLWGTVVSVILYHNKKMAITIDGKLICKEPITTVVIGNGCYFGGGMFALPHAIMDDGLFDIIILRDLSKLNLLLSLPRVYRGTHLSHPRINSLRGTVVEVDSEDNALLNLDGEQPGRVPVKIELLPKAIYLRG